MTENRYGKKIPTNGPRYELKKHYTIISLILLLISGYSFGVAYGHGIGSETFPPVELDGKQVTLEASSSQNVDKDDLQISISFLDFDSKVTLRDVLFHIRAERGDQFLFEREFSAEHGFLVFNFVSEDTDSILIEEIDGNLLGSLLGLESRKINVMGPKLSYGGLYTFDVSILSVDGSITLRDDPLMYNVGISVPQTVTYNIAHPDYGQQTIDTITYYDELSDFAYDVSSKQISFSMPFEWTASNIEQTSVVHQELAIPNTFGDLLVSDFSMYINDVQLPDSIVSIDDFSVDVRIVHFIVPQQELWNIFEKNTQQGMNFVIVPASTKLSSVTDNSQFRVLVSWDPKRLQSDSTATIYFDILDIFLKNTPIAVNYDFSVTQNDLVIFKNSATSTDSRDHSNVAQFTIPPQSSGIIHLNFENLNGNPYATASVPVLVDSLVQAPEPSAVPNWVKNNAQWWSAGIIDDETFLHGIEFLIQNDIIMVSATTVSSMPSEIPPWVKNNAQWWSAGIIDDETFIMGLQFLIEQGILDI